MGFCWTASWTKQDIFEYDSFLIFWHLIDKMIIWENNYINQQKKKRLKNVSCSPSYKSMHYAEWLLSKCFKALLWVVFNYVSDIIMHAFDTGKMCTLVSKLAANQPFTNACFMLYVGLICLTILLKRYFSNFLTNFMLII